MGDDVSVLRDEIEVYADEVVTVRVLAVPSSGQFPDGIKYAFHYGNAGAEHPIIRYDNHHGIHELHIGEQTYEIDFPGLEAVYEAWRAALPPDKRNDW